MRGGAGAAAAMTTCLRCPSLVLFALLAACDASFYHPSRQLLGSPGDYGLDYTEEFVPVADGEFVHLWHLFPRAPQQNAVVVHFHGNFGNMATAAESLNIDTGLLAQIYFETTREVQAITSQSVDSIAA